MDIDSIASLILIATVTGGWLVAWIIGKLVDKLLKNHNPS